MKKFFLTLLACFAHSALAQQLPPAADSAIARAAEMVAGRDSAGARRLLDSITASNQSTQLTRGEAMYWRAQYAASAAERERLLGSILIDAPFSPRVANALHELATMELERNDRDRASAHLARYLSASSPGDSARVGAALTLGRLLLERGEIPRACAVLMNGRSEVPDDAIELRNQFEFSVARCQGVDTSTKIEKPVPDTVRAEKRTGAFTVQVAAYDTKAAADRLATNLRGKGLEARVVGTAKPYRVRVGRYATRSEAEDASDRIDAIAKSKSIVVIVGPEER